MIERDTLPAFTFCTNKIISYTSIMQYYPEYIPLFKDYRALYTELIRIPKGERQQRKKELIGQINNIYKNVSLAFDWNSMDGY